MVARTFGTLTDSIARFQREGIAARAAVGPRAVVDRRGARCANPLMIIKGSLRALRREGAAPEEVREAAADIDTQVVRLDRVVGDGARLRPPAADRAVEASTCRRSRATRPTPRSRAPPGVGARCASTPRRRGSSPTASGCGPRSSTWSRTRARASRRPASPAPRRATQRRDRQPLAAKRARCWCGSRRRGRDRHRRPAACSSHTSRPSGPGRASGIAITRRTSRRSAARWARQPARRRHARRDRAAGAPPDTSAVENR